jgi:hypothetical protein
MKGDLKAKAQRRSAAEPQANFHHEGHEAREEEPFRRLYSKLRVLRVLRGEKAPSEMIAFGKLHCKGVKPGSKISSLINAHVGLGRTGVGKILIAPLQCHVRKLFIFGKIVATKERKERIDINLYGLFTLRSFVLFCGKSVFGCGFAALRLRAFALKSFCLLECIRLRWEHSEP